MPRQIDKAAILFQGCQRPAEGLKPETKVIGDILARPRQRHEALFAVIDAYRSADHVDEADDPFFGGLLAEQHDMVLRLVIFGLAAGDQPVLDPGRVDRDLVEIPMAKDADRAVLKGFRGVGARWSRPDADKIALNMKPVTWRRPSSRTFDSLKDP